MTSAKSASWEKELRKNICTNFGRGIRVNGENSGRTKLLYVYNEGLGSGNKRTSQTLPIEWEKTSGIEILKAIEFIKPLVVKQNLTLKEATRRWKAQFIGEITKEPNKAWEDFLIIPPKFSYDAKRYKKAVAAYKVKLEATKVDQFMATKQGLTSKTEKDWERRIRTFLEVMNKKPAPNTGEELVRLCAETFGDIDPDAKKRYIDGWCEILTYGIKRHSMNEKRWQPPNESFRKELRGKSKRTKKSKLTPYIQEHDLYRLLDDLESNDNEMFLATGLIAIFGLRLSELAELRVEDGKKLYVGHIKNNINTLEQNREERRVFAMDLLQMPNLGKRLISLYDSGLVKLPETIQKQIDLVDKKNKYGDVGKAFTDKLKKNPVWKEILTRKENSQLTPYSLRHRFAHQCHKGSKNPISIKDAAEAMGHNTDTHMKSYGSYTTEMSVERAFNLHSKERIEA